MSEHPRREALTGFLLHSLGSHEVKATVAHLLGGCDQCRDEMSPLTAVMFTPDAAPEPQLSPDEDIAYEQAISAAFGRALTHEQSLRREREVAKRQVEEILQAAAFDAAALREVPSSWGFCETLLEKSLSLRFHDRAGMLHLANLARLVADRLDPAVYGDELRTDMQARCWAELANAHRLNDDFHQAEAAMGCALDLRTRGTGDPLLYARIVDLNASLLSDQRRFKEAFRMLDLASAIHSRHSDQHEVGRIVLMKGLYTCFAGKPEEGIQLLVRGLTMIDRARDPRLAFHTLHNILLFRVELGQFEQARRQLQRMRPLYATHAIGDLTRLHWVEGQIAAGLRDLVTAEATFQQLRQDLDDAGQGYEAAIISLDLAGVWLQQGRTAEVRRLVTETLAAFQALGVKREAMSALQLLQETLKRDQATLEVFRLVGGILRRLRNEPPMRTELDAL